MVKQESNMNQAEVVLNVTDLSTLQCVVADFLWNAESDSDIQAINDAFGASEVAVVQELMLAAALDDVEDVSLANAVLKSFIR